MNRLEKFLLGGSVVGAGGYTLYMTFAGSQKFQDKVGNNSQFFHQRFFRTFQQIIITSLRGASWQKRRFIGTRRCQATVQYSKFPLVIQNGDGYSWKPVLLGRPREFHAAKVRGYQAIRGRVCQKIWNLLQKCRIQDWHEKAGLTGKNQKRRRDQRLPW